MYRINFRTYIPSVIGCEHFSVFQMALCPITHCICYFGIVIGVFLLPENPYVAHALEPVINLLHGAGFGQSVNRYLDEKPPLCLHSSSSFMAMVCI